MEQSFVSKCKQIWDIYYEIWVTAIENKNDKITELKKEKEFNIQIIKKNNMAILLISNIANKDKYSEQDLINKNRICLIYHLLCNKNYLKKMDSIQIADYIKYDSIRYMAGGGFIDNLCRDIITRDNNKIFKYK